MSAYFPLLKKVEFKIKEDWAVETASIQTKPTPSGLKSRVVKITLFSSVPRSLGRKFDFYAVSIAVLSQAY